MRSYIRKIYAGYLSGLPFSDVSEGQYYTNAVNWAVANIITEGTGNGKFSPTTTCNRAQIVTLLYRDRSDK